MAPRTTPNSVPLPRNENFANPYPASVARNAAPNALTSAYQAELPSQRQKTPCE